MGHSRNRPLGSVTSKPGPLYTARGIARLIHPFPTVANVIAAIAFATVADGLPPLRDALLLGAAMFGAQATIGISNDLADIELDSLAGRNKPLVRGRVGPTAARGLLAASALLATVSAATFGVASLALVALGIALGVWYNLALKRGPWSWLPYVLALPLAPIWVWTALGRFSPALLWLYPLGAPLLLALHLANALADFDTDRAAGNNGWAQHLGARRADALLWRAAALSLAVVWARVIASDAVTPAAWISVAVATIAGFAAAVVRRIILDAADAFRAVFGCLIVTTAALGLGWLLLAG